MKLKIELEGGMNKMKIPKGEYSKVYEKLNKEHPEYSTHVMSKEECVRYRKGWYYFQKYFFSLWD